MEDYKKEDIVWLLEDYNKIRGHGRVRHNIDAHLKAISIIKGKDIAKPSCSCEYGAYARMANSMY